MNDQIDKDELKENLKSQDTWLRLLFIIIYGVVLWALSIVLVIVVVFQFLSVLLMGETQKNLLKFGAGISVYVKQVVAYLTFNSEYKPFPFGDWPSGDDSNGAEKKKAAPKKKAGKTDNGA